MMPEPDKPVGKIQALREEARREVAAAPARSAKAEAILDRLDSISLEMHALPEALAAQVVPIMDLTTRLDEILAIQRKSLTALHDDSLDLVRQATEPTAARLEAGLKSMGRQAWKTHELLQALRGLPTEMDTAAQEMRVSASAAAEAISRAMAPPRTARFPLGQVLLTAVMAAFLATGGSALWQRGTHDSSRQQPSAKEKAWDNLYSRETPEVRTALDGILADSAKR